MSSKSAEKEKERPESIDTLDQLVIVIDFLKILPKLWIWFLVLILACSGLSYYRADKKYKPFYTARATFSVRITQEQTNSTALAFYNNAAAEQMVESFPYILTSSILRRSVADDMGAPVTSTIRAELEAANFLTLSVSDYNAQKAYDTLQSVIRVYPEISEIIVGKVELKLMDDNGVPTTPANSKKTGKAILRGSLIGLGLGLGWAVLVFITNRTIKKENDIKKKLSINSLGIIPRINKKKRTKDLSRYFILTDPKAKDVLQESFRMIRNKVEYHAHKYNQKTILVTSAAASEGKSFFASNLALSLVTAGKKVVLIDCDLRHPTGRLIFDMTQNTGLGEYLKGELELLDYLDQAREENTHDFPNFLFLPGGAPVSDGSHLLSNPRMNDLIACVKAKADYVILDCAPAGLLTDPAVLAKYADAALLVIRKEFARIDFISDALSHLSESNIQIIGGVLNDVQV